MAQQTKKIQIVIVLLLFIVYFIAAARPVPREAVLAPMWISSLESDKPVLLGGPEGSSGKLLAFSLGSRFGYVDESGNFAINKIKSGNIALSGNQWTEYGAEPARIEIKNVSEETAVNIEDPRGYPILLDDRVFILGSEQNVLSEIGDDGAVLWTYEFGAPLTCIDVAAGLVLTGSIDGIIEILDSQGKRIFYFEPGGSRYAVIYGCALSRSGSRLGIISGFDQQRFMMLERYGGDGDYKVIYHEFLDSGFRRPVRISFTDEDRRLVFERTEGIGCYNIKSRQMIRIPLEGGITAIDDSGDQGFLFLISSRSPQRKELIGIRFPQERLAPFLKSSRDMRDIIFLKASFKSNDVFLGRNGSMLIAGGGTTLISFDLEEK